MKLPLLLVVLFLTLAGLASAAFNITLNAPNEYFVHNASSIVFNWTARNDSVNQAANFSCFLYNTSASNPVSTNYSKSATLNSSQGNHSNATFSFADGIRVWWFVGCEDSQARTNTSFRIFDVDTSQFILSLGFNRIINFSIDSGDANFSGLVRAPNFAGNLTGNSTTQNQFENAITVVGSDLSNFTAGTNSSAINVTGNDGNLSTSVSGGSLIVQLRTIINGLVNVVTSRLEAVAGHFTSINSTSILTANASVTGNITGELRGNFTGNGTGNITFATTAGVSPWGALSGKPSNCAANQYAWSVGDTLGCTAFSNFTAMIDHRAGMNVTGNVNVTGQIAGNLTGNLTMNMNFTIRNDTAANGSLFTCGLFGAGEFRCANAT